MRSGEVIDVVAAADRLNREAGVRDWTGVPGSLPEALEEWGRAEPLLRTLQQAARGLDPDEARVGDRPAILPLDAVRLLPPVPRPPSFRDFYAFEQHVKTARAARGLDMVPAWYEIPVFYFSNPAVMLGDGAELTPPPDTAELDFELEVAAIVGRGGRDLDPEDRRGGRRRILRAERLVGPRPAAPGDGRRAGPGQGQGLRHRPGPVADDAGRARRPRARARATIWR